MDGRPFTWVCLLATSTDWVRASALKHCFICDFVCILVILRIWTWPWFFDTSTYPVIFGECVFWTIFANWEDRFEITDCFVFTVCKRPRRLCPKILLLKASMLDYVLVCPMLTECGHWLRCCWLAFLLNRPKKLGLIDWTRSCLIRLLIFQGPWHTSGHGKSTVFFIELTIVSILTRSMGIWSAFTL